MTTLTIPETTLRTRDEAPARRASSPWLVDPWFDALFLANIGWPLLFAGLLWCGPALHDGVRFWQVYFVTAAHRWITLPLVFLDRERFRERPVAFTSLAALAVLVCVGIRLSTGALTCLLTIDYLWNAWHFASQHAGIGRIYARQSGAGTRRASLEKLLMRGFLLYVILRMSGLEWALLGDGLGALGISAETWTPERLEAALQRLDWVCLAALLPLAGVVWPKAGDAPRGRVLYLASCLSLYASILVAVHVHRFDLVVLLATLSALFHAVEYLAIVSWAVHQRRPAEHPGWGDLLAALVPRWGLAVFGFALALAAIGWMADQQALEFWLLLNLIAAFLHYAYDGLIWKRRSPRMPVT
ncbi:MAG: hypothetical protein IT428_00770 [Planctomycetaceae bacterium]|nr:hypothetical protein [Planctomycetaceae bacterium]